MFNISKIEADACVRALTNMFQVLSTQVQTAEKTPETPVGPGDWVKVKIHKRKSLEPVWSGPWEVVERTTHALRVKIKTGTYWHHLTHCVPALPLSRNSTAVRTDLTEAETKQ